MCLKGKVALITGSSKGIGKGIASEFARQGATVAINGRNLDNLREVEDAIKQAGGSVLVIPADVAISKQVEGMVQETLKRLGKLDILVNNAGQMFVGTVEDITEEDWDRAMAVNLKSVFLCSKAVLPHMKSRNQGRIINISSAGGKNPRTITGTSYGVSKAGIIYLTKRMAYDFGRYGITVNCIAPGPVDTDMSKVFPAEALKAFAADIPLGRIGTPADVAKLAVFIASDDASYVTGEVIDINGGSYID